MNVRNNENLNDIRNKLRSMLDGELNEDTIEASKKMILVDIKTGNSDYSNLDENFEEILQKKSNNYQKLTKTSVNKPVPDDFIKHLAEGKKNIKKILSEKNNDLPSFLTEEKNNTLNKKTILKEDLDEIKSNLKNEIIEEFKEEIKKEVLEIIMDLFSKDRIKNSLKEILKEKK